MARPDPNRLFVREGFRHFRRTYSMTEVRWGFAVLAVLTAVVAWVAWRGANPREDLTGAVPVTGTVQPATTGDRGPLPPLAVEGWREGAVSHFDADNLYVKINGRADFFLSKGFRQLSFVSLTDDAGHSIDLELYDMGSPANALGAFSAERPAGTESLEEGAMQHYSSRNAVFLATGNYYARVIGSDDSEPIQDRLQAVRAALGALAAGERPWAYRLLVDAMGMAAGEVSFMKERAFSIEAARDVWVGRDGDTELFVVAAASPAEATTTAEMFVEGFAQYGTRVDGSAWVQDEFIGTFATARTVASFVIGIRGAAERDAAETALTRLASAVAALPPGTAPTPTEGADGEEAN